MKDTHGGRTLSNKTPALTKVRLLASGSLLHQINSLQEVLKLKQNFKKNKVSTGKIPFFLIGPFLNWPFYLSYHWLLIGQFCMEIMRFQS